MAVETVGLSSNKVMVTFIWDARSIIHIDYIQKERTINSGYHINLLNPFNDDLNHNQTYLIEKKFSSVRTTQKYTLCSRFSEIY